MLSKALVIAARRARRTAATTERDPALLRALIVADLEAAWSVLDGEGATARRVGPALSQTRRAALERRLRAARTHDQKSRP